MATTLLTDELLYEEKPLHVPTLQEVKGIIHNALAHNFQNVSVEVGDCPDLKDPFYGLVESGLGGSPLLLEIGGPPYLLPLVQRSKVYNVKEVVQKTLPGKGKILAIGAGAGPYPLRNSNCEGIFNMGIDEQGNLNNGSYTAKVHGPSEECVLERIPHTDPRCALLLNLYISRGAPGPVVKVKCSKRIGELNFIECIRKGLEANYKEKCVGMGGIFVLKKGAAHQHVMRDFSKTPLQTEEQLNEWLKFYEMPAQLNAVGTLVTHEHDLDLRLTHFHSFSTSNWGGHYHYDTTPDVAEYEAYLNVAERVVRVDRPLVTHKVGLIHVALAQNFQNVSVEVGDCPDLKDPFYGLVDSGLGGSPLLLKIGGIKYHLPLVQTSKVYNVKELIQKALPGEGKIFAIGAGCGPYLTSNSNGEGIYNLGIDEEGNLNNGSYTAKTHGPTEECVLESIPRSEPRCALLLNLFVSRGAPGPVLTVKCSKRIGEMNFIECIRKGLEVHYKEKCVGMGGIFILKKGAAYQHIIRKFHKTDLQMERKLEEWLKFYDMPAQLNALGSFVTHDNGLDLRLSHFHSFSTTSNWGGHYHHDTTPDEVEYEAYFNVAERLVRVDRPLVPHKVGRD